VAAWPKRALDRTVECGVCQEPVLISAYDARRVKPWCDTEMLGACHIDCILKHIARHPEMQAEII